MKTTDIHPDLNIELNWLLNSIISQKLKYSDHVKHYGGLEIVVMGGVIIGRRQMSTSAEEESWEFKTSWVWKFMKEGTDKKSRIFLVGYSDDSIVCFFFCFVECEPVDR